MGFLKSKLKKHNKYIIEIEEEDIGKNKFDGIEDVVIVSKVDFDNELNKLKELKAKIHSDELEIKLKGLKLEEKEVEVQKMQSKLEELKLKHENIIKDLQNKNAAKINKITNEKELEAQKIESKMEELKSKHETELNDLQNANISKINEFTSEKEHEIQKMQKKMHELEDSYKSRINDLEQKYNIQIDELTVLFNKSEENAGKYKKEYLELKISLENENKSLHEKLKGLEALQKQIEIYKIGNSNLKREIKSKKEELDALKEAHNKSKNIESQNKKEILTLQSRLNELEGVKTEYDKLQNNYRHLQEVANKKDNEIIKLEANKRRLEQYLSMSLEAINTLKNLGLFNRLFNRVPEGIDELQDDIKKLQPPKEIEIDPGLEIEPIRTKNTKDILGEKE